MNRQWLLAEKPVERINATHFELIDTAIPEPMEGELLVQHLYLSLIPATRLWMHRATYREKLAPGEVMPGRALGRVIKSRSPAVREGALVETMKGWQDYCVCVPDEVVIRDGRWPAEHMLGILGTNALTAYFGLMHVGRPTAGETLLVSAAAGGVGSLVTQLGKIAGCNVVGIAGGKEKCDWLTETVGADAALDYKADEFSERLQEQCPGGVDLYFDNTGGMVLETALQAMRTHGRIVCCGNTSQYDSATPDRGPAGVPLTLILKGLTMRGFVMMEFLDKRAEAEERLWQWYGQEKLKPFYHLVEGLERAPETLVGLLAGANTGLTMVRL